MIRIDLSAPKWAQRMMQDINLSFERLKNPSPKPIFLQSFVVADLPLVADYQDAMIIVSDESGGKVPAFSDGTNWLRVTDRAVVS